MIRTHHRVRKDSDHYLAQFRHMEGGYYALVCSIVNQAIIDLNDRPRGSHLHRTAHTFLKDIGVIV